MRLSLLSTCFIAALSLSTALTAAPAASPPQTGDTLAAVARHGIVPVNGVDYYYELHGQGEPLLLLHGGLGSGAMFGPNIEALAKHRTVILVDLQGHGRTALGQRPFSVDAIGDDMAALVQRLGYARVDVLGYSLGGGIALRMAVQQPAQVGKLVLVSASYSNDAFYPSIRGQQNTLNAKAADAFKNTPIYQGYAAVAPKPEEFPRLLDAIGGFLSRPFDWSADVPKLQGPVMLVFGDSDLYRPESEIAFFQLLGGGKRDGGWQREGVSKHRLAILPDMTHYEIGSSPRLVEAIGPFLGTVAQAAPAKQ